MVDIDSPFGDDKAQPMLTTTRHDLHPTLTFSEGKTFKCPEDLLRRYDELVHAKRSSWTEHYKLRRLLGCGGQGMVFLTERRGADDFTIPLAVKVFSPERYEGIHTYEIAMNRIAQIASRVAQIQQHNLLEVHNFLDRRRIRVMVMEWVDGYDLQELLTPGMVERIRDRVSQKRWDYINQVIVSKGPEQPRFKPGVAVAIVRDCLAALAALHREGIVHGDVKPSNLMLKRTGTAKLIDIGSAFMIDAPPKERTCTPSYAAPEVLEGNEASPRSDLASLGYVLIEMLAGRSLFAGLNNYRDLLEAKRFLAQRLTDILPEEIACNELLMTFCRGLIAPDPMRRFPTAEDAEHRKGGAAMFHRQLVKGDLASEYENEIRLWVEELRSLDEELQEPETE
ncbi:Serine/threonine-protein kinase PrkC [Blastopirellula retiformator]|uniref:Serine/threonine-protein kinase PrkC n=2 Tax=Blastopirellula retiformator TaxID=2527970 RepID=A0A5C5V0F1_9BACT|nr:Serine/threonine-protein kinase PrkC [Blastopirellula retiformator]